MKNAKFQRSEDRSLYSSLLTLGHVLANDDECVVLDRGKNWKKGEEVLLEDVK